MKSWYALDGGSSQVADAIAVDLAESAGIFAFDSGNPELLIRIADTCTTSGYWTVYAGTASDADFRVAIRDTETNELKWFRSQGGKAVVGAAAFPCGGTGGSGFDLDSENNSPTGMTYAGGFFYVVDFYDKKVYSYDRTGNRAPSRDFPLAVANQSPAGPALANSRLYVVDATDDKVYAYRLSNGGRDATGEFNLVPDNSSPRAIAYGGGYFYVVDWLDEEVYAYRSPRVPSKPDLLVSSVSVSDTSLAAGSMFTLNAIVQNLGDSGVLCDDSPLLSFVRRDNHQFRYSGWCGRGQLPSCFGFERGVDQPDGTIHGRYLLLRRLRRFRVGRVQHRKQLFQWR